MNAGPNAERAVAGPQEHTSRLQDLAEHGVEVEIRADRDDCLEQLPEPLLRGGSPGRPLPDLIEEVFKFEGGADEAGVPRTGLGSAMTWAHRAMVGDARARLRPCGRWERGGP